MTVAELMEELKKMPETAVIAVPVVGRNNAVNTRVEFWTEKREVMTGYGDTKTVAVLFGGEI